MTPYHRLSRSLRCSLLLVLLVPAITRAPTTLAAPPVACAPWAIVPSPASGEQYTVLTGITALSAHNVWAVGYAGHLVPHDGYAERPFVEQWNGTAWSIVPTPATGAPDSQLLAVAAVSPRTIWAVGFAGTHRAGLVHSLIERACRS